MTFSKPVLGTDTKKIKMSWMEYIFTHLVPTWFKSFNDNFVMWRDLITENYKPYKLLKSDNAEQECYDWFWSSINLDETYPKEFLEYLLQMVDDIDTGKVETVPLTEDFFDRLEDLVKDIELDDEDT